LADALGRVADVFAKERQHLASRDVVIKGMGYGGTHGASLSAFSAALKYGLIEQEGKDYRVSKRAVTILHPHSSMEKADAIRDASLGPALFSELAQHFEGDLPSDDNLRSYLVRRGFSDAALGDVIRSFRETMDLVTKEAGGYSPSIPALVTPVEQQDMETNSTPSPSPSRGSPRQYATVWQPSPGTEPFRVTFLGQGQGIEIVGRIADAESADELVRAVSALKLLLRPLDPVKQPSMVAVKQRAGELAASARYASYLDILTALSEEGFSEAQEAFQTREDRERLCDLIDEARKREGLPLSARGVPGQR
jgi:hypothetical protein